MLRCLVFSYLVLWVTKDVGVSGSGDVYKFCIWVFMPPPSQILYLKLILSISPKCLHVKLAVVMGGPSVSAIVLCISDSLFYFRSSIRRHIFSLFSVSCFSIPWPLYRVHSVRHLIVSLEEVVGWGRKLQPFKN